ncbi:MAG: hypothetical protein DMF90_22520 [Acidobacteria bacterium]|nr:MAG: hypothetical protein DMF90_22520 [Acidobacteriota bacterium]
MSVAPGRKRAFPVEGPGVAVLMLLAVVAGGTAGYVLIEGWSVWDAFYMTVITVTTVGYREVHDLRVPVSCSRSCCWWEASGRPSTRSRCLRRPWWQAACPSGCAVDDSSACSRRSRITSSCAATAASAASWRWNSGARQCPSSWSSATLSERRPPSSAGYSSSRRTPAGKRC